MSPKVCIVILNWNNHDDTLMCLDSIKKLKYPQFDIIVIDNDSNVNPEKIIKYKYPNVTFLRNDRNLGYTGGNNQGMRMGLSRGADYIWLLNNDTTVKPDTLMNMIDVAESSPLIGIVGPKVVQTNQKSSTEYIGTYINLERLQKRNFTTTEELVETENNEPSRICLWGTAILIKRNLIENIGLLDDRFFAYFEDMDYSLRAIKSGSFNKIAIRAVILHKPRDDRIGGIPEHYYYYMARNEYLFWAKHLEANKINAFKRNYSAKIIGIAANHKKLDSIHYANASLDGMWSAIFNKYGVRNQKVKMPTIIKKIILLQPFILSRIIGKF